MLRIPVCGSFLCLVGRRLGLLRDNLAAFSIDQNFREIARAGSRDIKRPDEVTFFVLDLSAFDRAVWDSCQCEMLRFVFGNLRLSAQCRLAWLRRKESGECEQKRQSEAAGYFHDTGMTRSFVGLFNLQPPTIRIGEHGVRAGARLCARLIHASESLRAATLSRLARRISLLRAKHKRGPFLSKHS